MKNWYVRLDGEKPIAIYAKEALGTILVSCPDDFDKVFSFGKYKIVNGDVVSVEGWVQPEPVNPFPTPVPTPNWSGFRSSLMISPVYARVMESGNVEAVGYASGGLIYALTKEQYNHVQYFISKVQSALVKADQGLTDEEKSMLNKIASDNHFDPLIG